MSDSPKNAQADKKVEKMSDTSEKEKETKEAPVEANAEEIAKLAKTTFASLEAQHQIQDDATVLKRATKLVRCIVTCNNSVKSALPGEIISARNSMIPEQKKFIPFNTPTHVPQIILNVLKEKQYQFFKQVRLPNGIMSTKAILMPEYNIQELPPLTAEEFNAIRQKQLAEGKNND